MCYFSFAFLGLFYLPCTFLCKSSYRLPEKELSMRSFFSCHFFSALCRYVTCEENTWVRVWCFVGLCSSRSTTFLVYVFDFFMPLVWALVDLSSSFLSYPTPSLSPGLYNILYCPCLCYCCFLCRAGSPPFLQSPPPPLLTRVIGSQKGR